MKLSLRVLLVVVLLFAVMLAVDQRAESNGQNFMLGARGNPETIGIGESIMPGVGDFHIQRIDNMTTIVDRICFRRRYAVSFEKRDNDSVVGLGAMFYVSNLSGDFVFIDPS